MKHPRKTKLWLSYHASAQEATNAGALARWLLEELEEPARALPFYDHNQLHVATDNQCIEIELYRGDADEGHRVGGLRTAERFAFARELLLPHMGSLDGFELTLDQVPLVHPSIFRVVAPTKLYPPLKRAALWLSGLMGFGLMGPALRPQSAWLLFAPGVACIGVRQNRHGLGWEIFRQDYQIAMGSDVSLLLSKAGGILLAESLGKRVLLPNVPPSNTSGTKNSFAEKITEN